MKFAQCENYGLIQSRLTLCRTRLGYSFQTLGDIVGISKSTLQRYETGAIQNIPLVKLGPLADALGVSPAYLMGWTDNPNEPDHHAHSEPESGFMSEAVNSRRYGAIRNRLKFRRECLGYSFQALSAKSGIIVSRLQRYEQGDTQALSLGDIDALAGALEVSPLYLMGWTHSPFLGMKARFPETEPTPDASVYRQLESLITDISNTDMATIKSVCGYLEHVLHLYELLRQKCAGRSDDGAPLPRKSPAEYANDDELADLMADEFDRNCTEDKKRP